VHADVDEGCPDQGICFFKADVEPYWSWNDNTSRIAVQYNCGDPEINGQDANNVGSEYELTVGDTYTARVTYNPVAETITHELFEGSSASGSPVDTLTLTNERLSAGAYRIGFHADLDTSTSEKAYFTYLEISEGPEEIITRVFRVTHLPHRRRRAENLYNGAPTDLQPGELVYGELENTLYTAKNDGTVATVGGNRAKGLAYSATINTNVAEATVFDVTLTGNATLAAPTNATNGQRCLWRIKRANGQALTLNAIFRIINGATIDNTDNATTYLDAVYDMAANRWDVILYSNKPATVPGSPTNVTAVTDGNANEIDLAWTAPTFTGNLALTDYVVQYSTNGGTTWTTFAESVSTATSLTVTALVGGTEHIFRVAAANSLDIGPYASSDPVTPLEALVPGAPTSVTGLAGDSQVALSWTAPTSTGNVALTDYVVQYSDDDGETWATFSDATSTSTSATVTGLTNDTAYVFRVAAVNSVGTGDYSATSAAVTPAVTALPDLLLHFNGANDGTSFNNNGTAALTVTPTGAITSTTQSKFGGASGYFNDSVLTIADDDGAPINALSFGIGQFTVDFWVYVTGGSTYKNLLEFGTSDDYPATRFALTIYPNEQLQVENFAALLQDPTAFPLNQWVHVAVTRDAASMMRLFINGVVADSDTVTQEFTANIARIGEQWSGEYFTGYMDELRVVKGEALYTTNFTPPTAPYANPPLPPSLLLHMDGANESTTFTDSSSNNWTVTPSGAAAISTTQSKFGGASGYFSSASVLTIPDHPSLEFGSADFTIEFWIYRVGASGFIAGKGDAATAAGSSFALAFNVGGPSSFYFDSTSSVGVDGMDDLSADQWQHVAFVRTAGDIVLYIDGLEVSRETIGSGVINDTAQPLKIGNYVGGSLECFIDELRIIKGYAAYTANFTPSTQPFADPPPPLPSLLLHMDGANESTTFTDSSSNNWTVTPSGGAAISTAQSKFGGASMYLDGTGAAVTASASIMDFGAGDFTVECWLYLLAEQYHGVVGSGADGGCVIGVAADGSVLCDYRGAGTGVTSSAGAASVNSWQHLAVTRSSGAVKIFVNGVAVATGTMSAAFSAAATTSVGSFPGPVWLLNGYVDELRIIKGYAAYTANFTPSTQPFADPPPPLPSLLLHMDGPSAVTDSSPNALTFTTPPGSFNTTTKKFGNASYSVDSLQGLATTTRGIPSLVGVNWTVEAWVYRLSGDATYACVVSLNGAADNSEFAGGLHLGVNANGSGYCNDGGSAAASSSAGAVPVGQWVHIAAVRSGGTTTLYFNGVADGTTSQEVVAGPYFANVGAVPGAPYSAFSSDILIDELRIIKGYAAYTTNFTPPTAPHGS
jgi:hypothetical protein